MRQPLALVAGDVGSLAPELMTIARPASARRVFLLAQEECRLVRGAEIAAEHIVVAVAHDGSSDAALRMRQSGLHLEDLRDRLRASSAPPVVRWEIGADIPANSATLGALRRFTESADGVDDLVSNLVADEEVVTRLKTLLGPDVIAALAKLEA